MHRNEISMVAALLLVAAGCGEREASPADTQAASEPEAIVAGDSILPMDTMITRFQGELPAVTSLSDDAPTSRDELIARFAAAVEDSSTEALSAITVSVTEFAHLYFPTSIYARAPYAQPPTVNWLLLEQNSLKGRARLLRYYGGRPLAVEGHDCGREPTIEGENRIHDQCTLRIRRGDGQLESVRLFGSILERGGRFKLMSLANRL